MKVITIIGKSKFPLGQLVITANAKAALDPEAIQAAVSRHASSDWGDVCRADAKSNEEALKHGNRIMSVYGKGDDRIWIITEADRSATTVMLPSDY